MIQYKCDICGALVDNFSARITIALRDHKKELTIKQVALDLCDKCLTCHADPILDSFEKLQLNLCKTPHPPTP